MIEKYITLHQQMFDKIRSNDTFFTDYRDNRGNSSVGRALPCQGKGRGFESRFPLHFLFIYSYFPRPYTDHTIFIGEHL